MFINKAFILGNLTREVELKALPNGTKVASFSIATNRVWKDSTGKKEEQVEYHNIIAFGKQAEILKQYTIKGSQLYVEGRIQTRSWEEKETQKKVYRTEICLENFSFGNKPKDAEVKALTQDQQVSDAIDYPDEEINAEDIPF